MNTKALVLLTCLCASIVHARETEPNTLKKVYHHKNDTQEALEWGKTAFYFEKEPVVKRTDSLQKGIKKTTFSFADTTLSKQDVKNMVEQFNSQSNSKYKARIQSESNNGAGVSISFEYDPKKIVLEQDSFDAITTDKGIIIRILNVELLSRLKEKGQPILQTACLNHRTVIIDCGHGGKDTGTIGIEGLAEKEVTLAIGNHVKELLEKEGVTVFMIRSSDVFVPLDERTYKANQMAHADLFVSIHGNWAANKNASGVETFCMTNTLFKQSKASPISDYSARLGQKSMQLATRLHTNVLKNLDGYDVRDRHVKQSVSQVLLGVSMPAALIEVGFLSHEKEGKLLAQSDYQKKIAHGICQGICSWYS